MIEKEETPIGIKIEIIDFINKLIQVKIQNRLGIFDIE